MSSVSPASSFGQEGRASVTLRSGGFSGGGRGGAIDLEEQRQAEASREAARIAEASRIAQEIAAKAAAQRAAAAAKESARQDLIRRSTATARSPAFDLIPFQAAARRRRAASRVKPGTAAERRLQAKGIPTASSLLQFEAGIDVVRAEALRQEAARLGGGLTRLQTERFLAGRGADAFEVPPEPKTATQELMTLDAEILQTPAPRPSLVREKQLIKQSIIGRFNDRLKLTIDRAKKKAFGVDVVKEATEAKGITDFLQTRVGDFNSRIESFNSRFGNRELSEGEFDRATAESNKLAAEEKFLKVQENRLKQIETVRLGRKRGPIVEFLKKKRFSTRAFDVEKDRVVIGEKDAISISDILTAPAVGVRKIGEGVGALTESILLEGPPPKEKTKGRERIETIFDIGSFAVPQVAVTRLGTKAITGGATAFDPTEDLDIRIAEGLEAGFSAGLLGAGAVVGGVRKGREPLVVKGAKPEVQSFAETLSLDIRQGEKSGQLAQTIVKSARPARQAFVSPTRRVGLILLDESQLARGSFEDLKTLFPKGRIDTIENAAFAASISEPFLVTKGTIVRPLRKGGRIVEVATVKGTTKRIEPTIISRLEGRSDPLVRELTKIDPTKLDKFTLRSLEELQKTTGLSKGLEITRELKGFAKGTKLGSADIVTTDLFKITRKDLVGIPAGRRIRRAKITSIQRPVSKTKFDREFGLKEAEVLTEEFAILDTTFPRTARPKKVSRLKGRVRRFEFEVPGISREPVGTRFPAKKKSVKTKQELRLKDLSLETIRSQTGAIAFRNAGRIKSRSPSIKNILSKAGITELEARELPRMVGGGGALRGQFAGQGTFELTDEISGFLTIPQKRAASRSNLVSLSTNLERDLSRSNFELSTLTRTTNKNQQKNLSKNLNKSISKNLSRNISRLNNVEKTLQKTLQKSLLKQLQKSVVKIPKPPRVPRIPFIPKRPKLKPLFLFTTQKKRRKDKRIRRLGDESILFVPGFTASALELTQEVSLKDLEKQARSPTVGLGLRKIPVILD